MSAPPHNIEAEQAILGAVLMNGAILDRLGHLREEHMFEPLHGRILTACRALANKGVPVSPITIKPHIASDPALAEVGGMDYVANMLTTVVSAATARDYADTVIECFARREVIRAAEHAAELASQMGEGGGAAAAMEALDAGLDEIRGSTQSRPSSVTGASALLSAMERMIEAREKGVGTPTGLAALDRVIGGLVDGDLTILAGRPSMGKTAIALSLARRMLSRGRSVIFVSLEMGSEDLVIRMASEELRERRNWPVHYQNIRQGKVSEQEMRAVMETARDMEAMPLRIIEKHIRRLPQIQAEVRRHVRQERAQGRHVAAVMVDYLGLIDHQAYNDNARVSHISAALKGMAGENSVPVVALSQLNRGVESRDDKRPKLSDLRDSGSVEQDADNVLFAYRPAYYLEKSEPEDKEGDAYLTWVREMEQKRNRLEIFVAKQRMGPLGLAVCECDLATNSIWDAEQ